MLPAAHGRLPPFVEHSGLELANLSKLYNRPPSEMLRIPDSMTAWMLDEAIGQLIMMLQAGYRLKPAETDNAETLRRLGVKIKDRREKPCRSPQETSAPN